MFPVLNLKNKYFWFSCQLSVPFSWICHWPKDPSSLISQVLLLLLLKGTDSLLGTTDWLKTEKHSISPFCLLSFALSHSFLQPTWSQERTEMINNIFVTRDWNYPQQHTLLRMKHPPHNNSRTSPKTRTEMVTNSVSTVVGTIYYACLCPCPQFFYLGL
jgi:hypothetical protein